MSSAERGHQLLLIEPSSVVRSIIASVARQLDLAQIHQTSQLSTAQGWLTQRSFDGILMSIEDPRASIELLTLIRMGQMQCPPNITVVALVHPGERRVIEQLAELHVKRTLSLPFRMREVVDAMLAMCPGKSLKTAR